MHWETENLISDHLHEIRKSLKRGDKLQCVSIKWPAIFSKIAFRSWPSLIMLRLLVPYYLPSNYEQAIYLDSDVILKRDIERWLNAMPEKMAIMGEPENYPDIPARLNKFGIQDGHYFNSGLIVINLKKYVELYPSESTLLSSLDSFIPLLYYPDQDALNILFDHFKEPTPKKSHVFFPGVKWSKRRNCIAIHYTTHPKPWEKDYYYPLTGISYFLSAITVVGLGKVLALWIRAVINLFPHAWHRLIVVLRRQR